MPQDERLRPRDVLTWAFAITLREDEAARLDAGANRVVALAGPKLLADDPAPCGFATGGAARHG
ncbi:MAG: hypothetical protein AB7K64_11820 [Variibacter sp.]